MKNCKPLGIVTEMLLPDLFPKIDWNNIWNRRLENGTAFEWTTLAAFIYAARKKGFTVTIPLIDEYDAGNFFILRNEIPLSHGSQAGNTSTALSSKSLKERFLYSMVPKAILSRNNKTISIFREGCPYHKIMSGKNYLERTDIILVPGQPAKGFPKLNSSETEVIFSYDYPTLALSGNLRILNSPIIPCRSRIPRGGCQLAPQGIIECSVNKPADIASEQLSRYRKLFATDITEPKFSLITGNDLSHLPFDTHTINLTSNDPQYLFDAFIYAAEGMLNFFIAD